MPKLTISFKKTATDLALYDEILKHSDRSAYIKDILKAANYQDEISMNPSKEIEEDSNSSSAMVNEPSQYESLMPYIKRRYEFHKKRKL